MNTIRFQRGRRSALFAGAFALCFALAPARGQDPRREIQELARRIDDQMQEIDRLLLESAKKGQARETPREKLQQVVERGQEVEQGIEELIEKLTEMKNQGGGSSSSESDQQPQPSDGQPGEQPQQNQNQRNRRENQTPDIVDQRRPGEQQQGEQQGQQQQHQPGTQPQQQPQGRQPQDGQEQKDGGQNTRGNNQLEPETAPGQRGQGEGSWGELQPYVNFLKNRGSPPRVPEKYRKYWEAYLKNKGDGDRR